jgi:pectate lyase
LLTDNLGLCDIGHAAGYVTVSNTHFHDRFKASLVDHSDSNGAEDMGYLHVTYANNLWINIESRMPLLASAPPTSTTPSSRVVRAVRAVSTLA